MIDIKKINDALPRIYQVLKFTPEEIKTTISGLAEVQGIATSAELLKSLSEDEIKAISDAAQKGDGQERVVMDEIAKKYVNNDDFKNRALAAAQSVIDEHIEYLKTRGDDAQKAEIAKILAELG